MLFFEDDYSKVLPHLRIGYVDFFHRALSYHFEVEVVSRNCDYGREVDRVKPDLILFDGNFMNAADAREIRIENVPQNVDVPRIGLIRQDAGAAEVPHLLDRLDRYGVEAFFAIDSGFGQVYPELGDKLYYWVWAVDDTIAKDYGLKKDFLVSMTGYGYYSKGSYPWRRSVFPEVASKFPCFLSNRPHRATRETLVGVEYAKILNRSWLSLGCGGHRRILVRKMLEIPACNSLLVTEETETIRAAGFIDGENCIFANQDEIVEKIDYALSDLGNLRSMILSGREMVLKRHSISCRTQILDWLKLRMLGKGEGRIIQSSPFEGLNLQPTNEANRTSHLGADCRIQSLNTKMEAALRDRNHERVRRLLETYRSYNKEGRDIAMAAAFVEFKDRRFRSLVSVLSRQLYPELESGGCSSVLGLGLFLMSMIEIGNLESALLIARQISPRNDPALEQVWRCLDELALTIGEQSLPWNPSQSDEERPSDRSQIRFAALDDSGLVSELLEQSHWTIDRVENGVRETTQGGHWAILGRGEFGKRSLEHFKTEVYATCFLDNYPSEEEAYMGKPVLKPEECSFVDCPNILVTNSNYRESVFQLFALGWPIDNIWVLDRESMRMNTVDFGVMPLVSPLT